MLADGKRLRHKSAKVPVYAAKVAVYNAHVNVYDAKAALYRTFPDFAFKASPE